MTNKESPMKLKYNNSIYPKVVVIKAAYHFTNVAYVHLDCEENYYTVDLAPKKNCIVEEQDFENEILAQLARYEIFKQTKEIREITLARALASSVVEDFHEEDDCMGKNIPAENILRNWFDR